MESKWRDRCVLTGLLGLIAICAYRLREVYADDAGIVLRYARNLVEGHGWVYNVGESVNATTSPLHVLVTAGFGALWGEWCLAPMCALALGLGVAVALVWVCVRPHGLLPATVAGLLAAVAPAIYTTLGLESTLLIAAALATTTAYARGRFALAGFSWGIAFLARPDAFLLGPVLLGHGLLVRRGRLRDLVAGSGAAAAVVLPWLVFATIRFGSPLPNTLAIKVAQRRFFGDGWIFAEGFWRELISLDSRAFGVGPGVAAACLLTGTAWLLIKHRRFPAMALFAGWALLQFGAYTVGNLPPYHWYYAPLLFTGALGTAALFASAWSSAWSSAGARGQRPLGAAAALILVCGQLALSFPEVVVPRPTLPHYRKIGAWLAANTPQEASIACADIGIVGFRIGPRHLIDMQGLVTAGAADAIARGDTGWWFEAHRPDYVVFHDPVWREFEAPALDHPDFRRDYEQLTEPVRGITVWARRRAPSSDAAPGSPAPRGR